mmetsp:Transcript_22028/g.48686  ORF Transcript_22028/g.48686 Transcript_22028/m.48686 type:complete len:292 (-) Transcript_22028:59-934(-)
MGNTTMCCREDQLAARWNAELYLVEELDPTPNPGISNSQGAFLVRPDNPHEYDLAGPRSFGFDHLDRGQSNPHNSRSVPMGSRGSQWGCCKTNTENATMGLAAEAPLEALSYMPVRFDESTTIDVERSHARYSKIVVHSTRARTQRRSKAWEDWLRGATAGRSITLLSGISEASEDEAVKFTKQPAVYYLDRNLSKLSIHPQSSEVGTTVIPIDNIQVICPATDFMLFFDQVDAKLEESEKNRAVLLQFVTEDTERKRVCFMEESESAKDRFVQALTALWLEKRNDHSMWF